MEHLATRLAFSFGRGGLTKAGSPVIGLILRDNLEVTPASVAPWQFFFPTVPCDELMVVMTEQRLSYQLISPGSVEGEDQ